MFSVCPLLQSPWRLTEVCDHQVVQVGRQQGGVITCPRACGCGLGESEFPPGHMECQGLVLCLTGSEQPGFEFPFSPTPAAQPPGRSLELSEPVSLSVKQK